MKRILNLGCGNDFYGTDRVDFVLTPAVTRLHNLELPLPYDPEIFDEVFASHILEHIKNIGTFANECFRVLKKGGRLIIHTDNANYLPFSLFASHEHNAFLDKQYEGDAYKHEKSEDNHYHLFVSSHLEALFKEFRHRKISFTYGGRNWFNNILLHLLPKKMGAIGIQLEAIK